MLVSKRILQITSKPLDMSFYRKITNVNRSHSIRSVMLLLQYNKHKSSWCGVTVNRSKGRAGWDFLSSILEKSSWH